MTLTEPLLYTNDTIVALVYSPEVLEAWANDRDTREHAPYNFKVEKRIDCHSAVSCALQTQKFYHSMDISCCDINAMQCLNKGAPDLLVAKQPLTCISTFLNVCYEKWVQMLKTTA